MFLSRMTIAQLKGGQERPSATSETHIRSSKPNPRTTHTGYIFKWLLSKIDHRYFNIPFLTVTLINLYPFSVFKNSKWS